MPAWMLRTASLAFALLALTSCSSGYYRGDYERVTSLIVVPARPLPDSNATIIVAYESSYAYPGFGNAGPRISYRVSGGELSSWQYGPGMETEWLTGAQISCFHDQVAWHTPDTPGEVAVSASCTDGGKTITVTVAPAGG